MNILVDSSVWIDYFKSGINSSSLDELIDQNLLCINELILCELVPFLKIKKQHKIIDLLEEITRIPLHIRWGQIRSYQFICLKNGIHKVGIPDLIILDNVIQNELELLTLDKHFELMNHIIPFQLYHSGE